MTFAERTDLLGVRLRYLIAVAACELNLADTMTLEKAAAKVKAALVIVGHAPLAAVTTSVLTYSQFSDRLGGSIFSLLPLDPDYGSKLRTLGNNEIPVGLQGVANDLFEQYVHAGLQFIFRSRVVRYGQERRGEEVPDGVTSNQSTPLLMYDAKAAKGGYEMTTTSERQFADYVNSFHRDYERIVGRLAAFLVISGAFKDSASSLGRRSRKVYADCGIPLSFLDAATFSEIVAMLVHEPLFRLAIDWRLVFSEPIVQAATVRAELESAKRDGLLDEGK
jgi:hypothetical protein